MRAYDFVGRAEALPFATLPRILGPGGLVVVAPHQDDESLGCGGLIALASAAGRAVHVVFTSDGSASHPHSRAYPGERLAALRQAEATAALTSLGLAPSDLTFMGLRDGMVPDEDDHAIATISNAARAIAATAIAVTWRHDPHCDHQASFALASAAARASAIDHLLEYPIWGHKLALDYEISERPSGYRLDIAGVVHRKMAAIRAHGSQLSDLITDDPTGFRLSEQDVARFERPFEIFLCADL